VTNQIYVVNNGSNSLTVIDGASNTVAATVPTGASPYFAAVNATTNMIYVANTSSNNVTVINGATNTVVATVSAGATPFAVAVNPASNQIYVANETGNTVTVIDGPTNTVVATVSVGSTPFALAVNPATNQIYVMNVISNNVTVINGATNTVAATVPVGAYPQFLAVNLLTNQIYVASVNGNNVTVIDGASNAVAATLSAGWTPFAIGVNPTTGVFYVANSNSSNVTVFTPNVTQTIPLTTTIAAVADSQTVSQTNIFQTRNPSPQFTVAVNSVYTSTSVYSSNSNAINPPPTAVYYQVDSDAGTWQGAAFSSTTGANPAGFSLQLSNVPSGFHTLYVYAAYGREGAPDGSQQGIGDSPDIGNITASPFLILPNATTTTLSSDTNPTTAGANVTFTASVAEIAPGASIPTGTITFLDGSTVLGTSALNGAGQATYLTSWLTVGSHAISAAYAGDANNIGSSSSTVSENVQQNTTTTLASSGSPSFAGTAVTFTATVTAAVSRAPAGAVTFADGSTTPGTSAPNTAVSWSPTGTVTFADGSTTLGTSALNASGVASYTTSSLSVAAHSIVASYGGDALDLVSTSAALAQTVSASGFTISANPASQTITDGQTAKFVLTVTPQGSFTNAINFACSGLPALATCMFTSNSVTPNSSTVTSTLTITTVGRSIFLPPSSFGRPGIRPMWPVFSMACTLALFAFLFATQKRNSTLGFRRALVFASFLLVVIGSMTACAGGSAKPTTPLGTAQVQVTASSSGGSGTVSHSSTLTLTIQ
jgi:YVTN family beta-propeller protein